MTKWFALSLSLAAPIAMWACAAGNETRAEALESSPPELKRAQATSIPKLWKETCANCHGDDAGGGGAGTKSLLTKAKFDQTSDRPFFETIKNGSPDMGMVAYSDTLRDEEMWGLVVYIRELQARALRAEFGSPKAVNGVYRSKLHSFRVETVIERGLGLETPWAVDFLPDGKMLITNRPGEMFVTSGPELGPAITGLPEVIELGQGGLMDVTVHPDYANNGWIYLGYTEPSKTRNRAGNTKIVRGKLKFSGSQATWTSQQTIFETDQEFYTGAGVHFGTRIVFNGKGHIFFVVGERGGNMLAQSIDNPFGKIYRTNEDGTIPADNPYAKSPGKKHVAAIWTLGHRNPQGLAMGLDGNLWDTEHGPRGGDEVNLIVKGANYGWPVIAHSINYSGAPFRTPWGKEGENFTQPIFRWLPSTGASGLDIAKGDAFPKWKGDLLAGGLVGANLDRIRTKDGKFVEREELLHGLGRIRDVQMGPGGHVYVVLNGPDKVIRLVPAP